MPKFGGDADIIERLETIAELLMENNRRLTAILAVLLKQGRQ